MLREAGGEQDPWSKFSFNVPGLSVLGGDTLYEYKLPYVIQQIGCCATISPWCYCCDLYLFKSCNKMKAPTFMDMVDQRSGDQVRYRAVKSKCMPPKVLMFRNGKFAGHASRTLRCCNRCRTCTEDVMKNPVNLIGLHGPDKSQVARIERDGRGCCLDVTCNFPFKCIGCCFYCATCTVALRPSPDPFTFCGYAGDYACMPHGCLTCNPVCCAGCLRGPKTLCLADDIPCLAMGLPAPSIRIWCPMATCKSRPLEMTSTIMVETHGVVSSAARENLGIIQFQYRGNFPSAYTHDQTLPLNAAVAAKSGDIGLLASSVVVGKVYGLGDAEAPFYDLPPRPAGRSPDFEGWVTIQKSSQMKDLITKLRADLVVDPPDVEVNGQMVAGEAVLGDPISGVAVKGWVLTDLGFTKAGGICGGASKQLPRPVGTVAAVQEIVDLALSNEIGEYGTNFDMRFRLPDHEKQVVSEGVAGNFNAMGQGFAKNMLEEVACACMCVRVWKCPFVFAKAEKTLCKIPLYARKYTGGLAVSSKDQEYPPVPVVMNTRAMKS